MGEVYRARDTRLGRDVAIKVLPEHLSASTDFRQRFEREAKSISSLQHPHICVLHDIGSDGSNQTLYLVMELLEGETLAERIRRGPLPLDELLSISVQVASALDKAHRQGIIHRDLKPSNVMLTKSGAKLMDFGLAKPTSLGAAAGSSSAPLLSAAVTASGPSPMNQITPLTTAGSIVGTIQYMSPEQIEGREADARSDIFAFGALMYEMATGQRAFGGKSQISVASAILEKDPEPISKAQATSPPVLDRIVQTCLNKDSEDRFQCAHDLKMELEWVRAAPTTERMEAPVSGRRPNWLAWGVAAVMAVAAILATALHVRSLMMPAYSMHSYLLPPEKTEFYFTENHAGPVVVSPDGRRIAFVAAAQGGEQMVWVQPLNSSTAQPLSGTEEGYYPFWSADNRYLGYFAKGKLYKVDASGGPPQALCDALDGRGGAWNQDGTILFTPDTTKELMQVEASGGTPTSVTNLGSGEISHRWPSFLPDGKHFIYFVRTNVASNSGIYLGALGSKEHKLLIPNESNAAYVEPGYLLFVRDGTLMAQSFDPRTLVLGDDAKPVSDHVMVNSDTWRGVFTASASGNVMLYQHGGGDSGSNLTWFDREGKQGQVLFPQAGEYYHPALSPDGKKLAIAIFNNGTGDIWVVDLERKTKTRITFGPKSNDFPAWWPDGKSVVYAGGELGSRQLYRMSADGTGQPEGILTDPGADVSSISISPDGRYIAYQRQAANSKTGVDVWAVPTFGDRKPFPVVNTVFVEGRPSISPDGKWLAYMSNDSGRFEIYIRPFPTGEGKWQVSTQGGFLPQWRKDGKELFFMSAVNSEFAAVDVSYAGSSIQLGTPHSLFKAITVAGPLGPYTVSADGKAFLINAVITQTATEPLSLVTNWTADLRK